MKCKLLIVTSRSVSCKSFVSVSVCVHPGGMDNKALGTLLAVKFSLLNPIQRAKWVLQDPEIRGLVDPHPAAGSSGVASWQ